MTRLRFARFGRALLAPSIVALAFLVRGVAAEAQVVTGPSVQLRGATGAFAYDSSVLRLPRWPGRLEGTLLKPRGVPRPPLVLLVGGAGPTNRDGNLVGAPGRHDALRQLAESLAVNGIASFRFDKRGVGASASARIPELDLRFQIFGYDVASWIDLLSRRGAVGPLFVAGHDEGALTGLMSLRSIPAAGYITLAAPARSLADVMRDEIVAAQPSAAPEVDSIITALREDRPVARLSLAMSTMFPASLHNYLSSSMRFSAMGELSALNGPCLVVHGRHDAEVAPANADSLAKAQRGCVRTMIDSMTHTLKRGPADLDGQGPMYLDPSLPLAPGLVSTLLDFIHLIADEPPAKCSSDEAGDQPRVLIGRPQDRPNGASPTLLEDRYLGPFATATLVGLQVDSIATRRMLTGDAAGRYGPTARKCGAVLMRTTEGFAGDTAEVVAAIWKAESTLHRPARTVLIDVADSTGGRTLSPLLRREIARRGMVMSERAAVGDDTVRVVPELATFGRDPLPGGDTSLEVRTTWTTRVETGASACRVTWRATASYAVFMLAGAVKAVTGVPATPIASTCVPIPPGSREE